MRRLTALFSLLTMICFIRCAPSQASERNRLVKENYPRWIGDIAFDPATDNPDFTTCKGDDKAFQYFNLGDNIEIEGEKYYINETFREEYDNENVPKESGLVRIRFLVNCKGETDRFRLLTSDLEYQEKEMDSSITDQLMHITKSLKGWKKKYHKEQSADYYQFLVFRIVDGKIVKILP